jgi:ribosomal protein S27AE
MGFIASLFCQHRWDGGWERSKHQCSKCGKRELHEWEPYTPATESALPPKTELAAHAGQQLLHCAICGAMKWR